jgi:hypothetical protein
MSAALIAACLWALLASLIALGPRRFHWRAAWGLIAAGVPILGWVTYENGPLWGLICLAGGLSVLRWPLRRLLERMGGAGPQG